MEYKENGNGSGKETGKWELAKIIYSLESSPVRFTELYKPRHWYTIVVKFFLLHKALSNKSPYKRVYQLTSFVIIM